MDKFSGKINTPESVKQWGTFSHARIAKALKGMEGYKIEQLYRDCLNAKSFGALFNHLTKRI